MNPFKQYINLVLKHPVLVIVAISLFTLILGFYTGQFRLDASADSLVVDGDADLAYSREVGEKFGTNDFVFVVYTPHTELFTPAVLADLRLLRDELSELERVESVDSIFSVPLFKLAGASLSDVANNVITLEEPGLDLAGVKADLLSNNAYRDVLISADGLTTALIVNITKNEPLSNINSGRSALRLKANSEELDALETAQLSTLETEYARLRKQDAINLHQDIASIREILTEHQDMASIVMGGVPMIADDLVSFVRKDLGSFGIAILLFIIAALWFFFRKVRYVVLPLLCGGVITISIVGILGFLDWPVTVISSNFISLLLIITVSLTVHLIVRYRELQQESPSEANSKRLELVLKSMILPCAYTSMTTIVAFGSLVISDIPPVVDFGLMMVMGVFCSFVLSFLLFPALMVMLKTDVEDQRLRGFDITPQIGRFTERHGNVVLFVSLLVFLASVIGITRLKVENSFIDYFDEKTEIYQGMLTIDQRMGGTTPLDVIVTMQAEQAADAAAGFADDEFWEDEEEANSEAAWFTSDKMRTITAMHNYLDDMDETGKVLSLATLLNIAYELNDNQELNSFELGILYNRIPENYKQTLLKPYVSVPDNEVRFSIRIRESDPDLKRSVLLEKIHTGLMDKFGLEAGQVHLSGMLVLYNNMLQSLFESQIETLSVVMFAIFLMFIILFRSLSLAVLGIIPNLLAALSVLGLMGLTGIPLDMMTITIAAIVIGIGVDNTIHYIHRFKQNYPRFKDYLQTMHYCHGSIGKAMYYTSFTITAGFSILVLSNFVPTVYFGLLTSLAMLLALAGALTLLPLLIVKFKPLGPESQHD